MNMYIDRSIDMIPPDLLYDMTITDVRMYKSKLSILLEIVKNL